jgi:hypothetical protein
MSLMTEHKRRNVFRVGALLLFVFVGRAIYMTVKKTAS